MPLIVICGLPSSGKTSVANDLHDYLKSTFNLTVATVSDTDMAINKNLVYGDPKEEKILRSNLKAEVQRNLTKDQVVILDSLNYIKGYRYELFCIAKSVRTTYCVICCVTSSIVASQYNLNRAAEEKYSNEIFTQLVDRFEHPNSSSRWDSPLFICCGEQPLDKQSVYDALFCAKPLVPNHSTETQPLSDSYGLQDLDRTLQQTIMVIVQAQKLATVGDEVAVGDATIKLKMRKLFTIAELGRLKRQFIAITKQSGVDKGVNITNVFIQYLNNHAL